MFVYSGLGHALQVLYASALPDLTTAYFAGGTDPCIDGRQESDACREALRQASTVMAIFGTLGGVSGVLCSPLMGAVAEVFSIKAIMCWSMLSGVALSLSLLGFVHYGLSIYWLCIMGELAAVVVPNLPLFLWIAKYASAKDRIRYIGWLQAISLAKGLVLPTIGTVFQKDHLPQVLVVGNLIWLALLPLLPREDEQAGGAFEWRAALGKTRHEVKQSWGAIAALTRAPGARLLLLLNLLIRVATQGWNEIILLYLKASLGLKIEDVARPIFMSSLAVIFCLVCLVRPCYRCFSLRTLILVSFGCTCILTVGWIFATSILQVTVIMLLSAPLAIVGPGLQGSLIEVVKESFGSVGVMQSVWAIGEISGPLVFKGTFSIFVVPASWHPAAPSAPVWLLLILKVACFLLAWQLPLDLSHKPRDQA